MNDQDRIWNLEHKHMELGILKQENGVTPSSLSSVLQSNAQVLHPRMKQVH